jgi:ABC-2 type transport system permease protein
VTSIPTEVRPAQRSRFSRYRHSLWLLTKRDLRVRYSTSVLGYLWSILDPLVMSAIYWFVFTVIFKRDVGENPYIVFLLAEPVDISDLYAVEVDFQEDLERANLFV